MRNSRWLGHSIVLLKFNFIKRFLCYDWRLIHSEKWNPKNLWPKKKRYKMLTQYICVRSSIIHQLVFEIKKIKTWIHSMDCHLKLLAIECVICTQTKSTTQFRFPVKCSMVNGQWSIKQRTFEIHLTKQKLLFVSFNWFELQFILSVV